MEKSINNNENEQSKENTKHDYAKEAEQGPIHGHDELTDGDKKLIEQLQQDREHKPDYDRERGNSVNLYDLLDSEEIHQYELWLEELREASRGWRDRDKDVELER